MKKLFRYLFNIFLFVFLWCIQSVVIINFSVQYIKVNPLFHTAVCVVIVIFTSYKLVKILNKSTTWEILFGDRINIKRNKRETIDSMN